MHYHVSDIEGLVVLMPHVPEGADWGEPTVPRVCAAPSIEKCLLSLEDINLPIGVVYAIDRSPDVGNVDVQAWPDGYVDDAAVTGEVWYLAPVPCQEVARATFENGQWKMNLEV